MRRASEVLVGLLLLVPPFLVAGLAKESFRQPKLYVSGWLALASLLPLAWSLRRAGRLDFAALGRLPALRVVLPILAIATLGLATTRHPVQVREGLLDLWIGAAALVGWSAGLARPRLLLLLRWLLLPAAVLAAIGILQYHDLWQPLALFGMAPGERLAVTSLAGNPGDLGAYLALPCLLGLFEVGRRMRQGDWRQSPLFWLLAAALAVCLYALFLTQTISALTAVAIGGLFLLASWSRALSRRRVLALVAAGLLVAVALCAGVAPLRERLLFKVTLLQKGNWNAVFSGRFDGWRAAVWMFEEHPWAGVGHGAYRPEYIPAKLALLDRGAPFAAWQPNPVFANAHSEPLEVAAEWGVPGLLALAWAAWVLYGALRARAADGAEGAEGAEREERGLAWAGTAAIAILALAYFPFRLALLAFPALLFLSWVLAPSHAAEPEAGTRAGTRANRRRGELTGFSAGLLAMPLTLALLVALAGQTARWRHRLEASRVLRQVELNSLAALQRGEAPVTLMQNQLEALRQIAPLDPVEVGIPIARGTQYLFLAQPEAAIGSYQEALALEPRPEIYMSLGRATWLTGRHDEARQLFTTALRLDGQLARELPEYAAELAKGFETP
jgi:O-antigen ligase